MSTPSPLLDASTPALPTVVQPPAPAAALEIYSEVARLGIGEQFPEVIALTRELFGDFTIKISEDPEIQDCTFVTLVVRTGDALDEAFAKESEWIRRLPRCPTTAPSSYCLHIDFVE